MSLENKRGQGVVEFAIVLPIFMLILVGFMHMALVIHDYLAMGEATREVARYAVVGKPEAEIREKVKFGVTGFYKIDPKNENDVEINYKNNADLGDYVEVKATMKFDASHGVLLTNAFMPKQLSTSLMMRKE